MVIHAGGKFEELAGKVMSMRQQHIYDALRCVMGFDDRTASIWLLADQDLPSLELQLILSKYEEVLTLRKAIVGLVIDF